MQKLQNSVFSIVKTTNLSPAVFSFLQPVTDSTDQTPLGGILRDTKYGWLALGPKFCVVDLRSGLKIAARNFEFYGTSSNISVTSVVELPTPLKENTQQLIISLECDDTTGIICVLNINGSQLLRCIQTDVVISKLSLCDGVPVGPFECFDGLVMAGTRNGEIFVFDLNRDCLIQALKDITNGYENQILGEGNAANLIFLPLKSIHKIERQREQAIVNNDHLAVLLNENSFVDGQYMFCNPDGTIRMKAKRDHIRVTVVEYIPQLGSLAVGFNFGAFQLWDLLALKLEFTSQVNVECLPVTHFGFQEPCDDPRAFCYLWVVFSVIDRLEEEEFPLAVMYSLTYLGKRMLSDTECLYQDFSTATVRFQIELGSVEDNVPIVGGRCISCHTYSINSTLAEEGEDTMLNLCQLVWECWGENINNTLQHGMLLFDLDQWYKDQMPATYNLESNPFMSTALSPELGRGINTLDLRLDPSTVSSYSHATRLEEHFYPNSLQYNCVCLNTCSASVVRTAGIQRQIVRALWEGGPACLLRPARLHAACLAAGLAPLYHDTRADVGPEDQRRFLLSVALEARLSRFLKRCAQDWATGTHSGVGCTLTFLTDWCWRRAIEIKENAKELTAPLFTSSILPDKNVVRCLEHCVQQLSQLAGLLDAVLTKCCNLVIPEALSEIEEKYKGVGTVSLYFTVVQWCVRVGLLPERAPPLPYPGNELRATYCKRRLKLHRLQDKSPDEEVGDKPSELMYIDQLIENEFGGETVYRSWRRGEVCGLYPSPSLCALVRLYLRADVHTDHKHALMLYLLLDYCALYDDLRYEAVIRRLMQFPTMFGLSNTAIKATQAFWHLDHRDFDFALDQLQCLTGNTLSDWQHKVVLSALLAQKKSQAALQYLHVRKPAPIQKITDKDSNSRVNEHDKLEDWQSCCNLYLARGLVFEALDVIRTCVKNSPTLAEKTQVLNFFYKGCRNTGQLSKVLQVSLLPFEEEVFTQYLQECNDVQTSDILLLYYLQQARYLEAEAYSAKAKPRRGRAGVSEAAATLLDVACRAVPRIAAEVARTAALPFDHHVVAPKPMSVFIQAMSPRNTFTYKSSFIQDTIENASETWINRPKTRKGIKRALNIEETPFICTPKLSKTKSYFSSEDKECEATPPKRSRPGSPGPRAGAALSLQVSQLLDMPDVHSPTHSPRADTPQSILKNRRPEDQEREMPSPVDSRYLGDSDDDLETASNHTHCSDTKHLRFTIPTASEGSTPSPVGVPARNVHRASDAGRREQTERHVEEDNDTQDNEMSPPKKFAAEEIKTKKTYKDTVRARKSLSISINSSLSDDPSTSIESIADISVTLLNARHPRHRREHQKEPQNEPQYHTEPQNEPHTEPYRQWQGRRDTEQSGSNIDKELVESVESSFVPGTPKGRRSIRRTGEIPSGNRSRPETPERQDSPIVTPLRASRATRSKSRTPERSPKSPLAPIPEQPKQEVESEPHALASMLSIPRKLRSRSRTPERTDKVVESPRLEAIVESPTKPSPTSPSRSLRSRSRTPEVEAPIERPEICSPRSLRSRSKTPEKLMSPKKEQSTRNKKSLSRMVLEANTFSKTKQIEKMDLDVVEEQDSAMECTPMKSISTTTSLLDVTFSPIVNKSVLQSSSESIFSLTTEKISKTHDDSSDSSALKTLPAFTTINQKYSEKSVLHGYESSVVDTSSFTFENKVDKSLTAPVEVKILPAFTTITDDFGKSVLKSCESSAAETSSREKVEVTSFNVKSINDTAFGKSVLGSYDSSVVTDDSKPKSDLASSMIDNSAIMTSDSEIDVSNKWKSQTDIQDSAKVIQKEKERIVEIEREINEIEDEMSEDNCRVDTDSGEEMNVEVQSNDSSESTSTEEDDNVSEAEEVISIDDSDDSSSSNKLQIDEASSDVPVEIEKAHEDIHEPEQINTAEEPNVEDIVDVQIETQVAVDSIRESDSNTDPLNQANMSMLTDDNSVIESDQSVNLNYSEEKVETEIVKEKEAIADEASEKESNEVIGAAIAQSEEAEKEEEITGKEPLIETKEKEKNKEHQIQTESEKNVTVSIQQSCQAKSVEELEKSKPVVETTKEIQSDNNKAAVLETGNVEKINVIDETTANQDEGTKAEKETRTRKRSNSTASNKSRDVEIDKEEPKTPMTRKRTQSIASEAQSTPEEIKPEESTPSRRRAKTPTSTEVRRILTRRASKELSESKIEEDVSVDEVLTPRRSTRRSKKDDDNASVASESSTKSNRSRASEDAEVKAAPIRKGRKSILSTKTDLSVIPETTTEEPSNDKTQDILSEYSSARRLTRHQKAVLDSWLEPQKPRRRNSRADHDTTEPQTSKEDEEGSSDGDGTRSPETTKPRSRLARAASETKVTPKPARATRRISVDVVASPEVGSPSAEGRGRRASFAKAVQALHTPTRRLSTDQKTATESREGSPAASEVEVTPARRGRRPSATNTGSAKAEPGKRSRKVSEKNKEGQE